MSNLVKVREYKARRFAKTGIELALPAEFCRDARIKPGDLLALYRDPAQPGVLIVAKAGAKIPA